MLLNLKQFYIWVTSLSVYCHLDGKVSQFLCVTRENQWSGLEVIIIYVIVYNGKYWLIVTDGQENH